ncbi:MAG TPA: PQQ-dependent sugar dehydrogenase [Solirubrobacterales bacterium]|nr:PQQ-dependent sugar dehydrogenase [Solirubrobacterales bacterium]
MNRTAVAVLLGVAFVAGGCGDDGDSNAESTTEATTTTPTAQEPDGARIETGDGEGGVGLEEIGTFDDPVYVAQPDADTDHLYVVERCGRIMRIPYGGGEPEVFLDVAGEITCDGTEQGLLSVAFHPGFGSNGRFYVFLTDTEGDERIVAYESTAEEPRKALPGSARELLRVRDFAPNHNGGQLQFGPDRKLYAGLGDGGGAGDPERTAQDRESPLGKILRIDDRVSSVTVRFVASGLRNPWRFSFDRAEGDLWIGDVGQDAIEEIDAAQAADVARGGLNFGWSAFEGRERFNEDQEAPGAIPPVLEYPLDGSNCAVTGGYVARDPSLRSLFGRYLYGDFCAGELRSFTAEAALRDGEATDDRELGIQVPQLSSFGEDASGHLYAVSLDGPVYRLAAIP